MGIGDYLNVYSLETKELVSCSKLNFPFEGVSNDEPEAYVKQQREHILQS